MHSSDDDNERHEHLSDEELLRLARRDDASEKERHDIYGMLYARHYQRLATWCLRFSAGDETDAADLAQDTVLRAHRAIDRFSGQSSFGTWLYTIARRAAINRSATRARRPTARLDDELLAEFTTRAKGGSDPSPEEAIDRRARVSWLRRSMAQHLEPLEQRIIYLHYHHAMSLPEITHTLELENRSGAKAYLVSAQRKLKQVLARDRHRPGSGVHNA